ncbi:hypothetical protein [Flavobacterium sp.]|uniref:hypothetical protein n=1 Tax=Flavobacterium sp. TaxID=239 RepID=UPI0031E27C0A
MIIYGYRKTKTKSIDRLEIECESCGKTGTTAMQFFQEYMHIFWILPVFPSSRFATTSCKSCGYTTDSDAMPPRYKAFYDKQKPLPPIWLFTGIAIVLFLLGARYWQQQHKNVTEQNRIAMCGAKDAAPERIYQVGVNETNDEIDFSKGNHKMSKLIQIVAITNDSIKYYKGYQTREVSEDIMKTVEDNHLVNQFDTFHPYTMSVSDFRKLEIVNCR